LKKPFTRSNRCERQQKRAGRVCDDPWLTACQHCDVSAPHGVADENRRTAAIKNEIRQRYRLRSVSVFLSSKASLPHNYRVSASISQRRALSTRVHIRPIPFKPDYPITIMKTHSATTYIIARASCPLSTAAASSTVVREQYNTGHLDGTALGMVRRTSQTSRSEWLVRSSACRSQPCTLPGDSYGLYSPTPGLTIRLKLS
jgi:hypothetical protein